MNQKGNWYIKLRTTKRCDMIKKKKARRSPPPSNCIRTALGPQYSLWTFHLVINTIISCVENSIRAKRILFITMLTSRPWTVENHYKIEIRGVGGGGGLEIQKMMNREYNRHEIKGLKFEEISKNWTICFYMYFGIFRYSRTKCQSSCYLQEM